MIGPDPEVKERRAPHLASRLRDRFIARKIICALSCGAGLALAVTACAPHSNKSDAGTPQAETTQDNLRVAAVFQDHAVLQRGHPVAVWGKAAPGARVSASLDGQSVAVDADADGRWRADLPAPAAGGPYVLAVESGDVQQTFADILVGDVWLCSGQSNMEFNLGRATNAQIEVDVANDPKLRLLQIEHVSNPTPQDAPGPSSKWRVSTPENAAPFSAVCHFFGRELRNETKTPIGLIDASWGGSIIQDWIDPETLQALGGYEQGFELLSDYRRSPEDGEKLWLEALTDWAKTHEKHTAQWSAEDFDDTGWPLISPSRYWEEWGVADLAAFDGIVWFRTSLVLTAAQAKETATITLGPVDDIDTVWINGVRVGGMRSWNTPREYSVPPGVLHAGENTIAIRVIDSGGGGGLWGAPEDNALHLVNGETLPLAAEWRYRISAPLSATGMPPIVPWTPGAGLSTLYGGMIAPLTPYGVKGFVWYQGEANVAEAGEYARLVPALMASWRKVFEAPDAPFIQTQLTAFGALQSGPRQSSWAELRDVQRRAAAADPNAGMAVIVDIGDPHDIHPTQKKIVGQRLALEARRLAYGGTDPILTSPSPISAKREGAAVRVKFSAASGGLVVIGDERPIGFELCDAARNCRYAETRVDGDSVTLFIPSHFDPAFVRSAWADSPITNLFNLAMLPATPFEIPVE